LSIDAFERRQAVEARLLKTRKLAQALEQAATELAARNGMPIETLDPVGSLRTSMSALAGVAAKRPGFDVLVSLPDSPHSLRVRNQDEDVHITLETRTAAEAPAETAPAAVVGADLLEGADVVASDLAAMLWQDIGPP
jgi:hypothetical protein